MSDFLARGIPYVVVHRRVGDFGVTENAFEPIDFVMDLFVDNTSIHAVGRCLQCTSAEQDVKDLLQFATHLVYSDNVAISSFEPPSISNRTEEICNLLWKEDIRVDELIIQDFDSDDYKKMCDVDGLSR